MHHSELVLRDYSLPLFLFFLSCFYLTCRRCHTLHTAKFTALYQVLRPVFLNLCSQSLLNKMYWDMNPFHSCRSSSDSAPCGRLPCSCVLACRVCCCIFSGLLFVTSGSAVIDYEIQRRAFGRHTSPLACYLTTIDFLGPCLCCCIKSALSSPWYKALLTTVSLFFLSFHPP